LKEFRKIIEEYDKINFAERKTALATVMRVSGSAYRRPGARMLIVDNGKWYGAISGGCLEGDALRKARKVILEGKPELVIYDTMSDDSATSLAVGLGCNGVIEILIEPIDPENPKNPIAFLKSFLKNADITVQATVFSSSNLEIVNISDRVLFCNNEFETNGDIPLNILNIITNDIMQVWKQAKPKIKKYITNKIELEVLIEILNPGIQLYVFGGGFDTNPIVQTANQIGWNVIVTDDCIAHLGANRFPLANEVVMAQRDQISSQFRFNRNSAAVLISHNFKYDLAIYKELNKTNIKYIGIMGPKKRFLKMIEVLQKEGFPIKKSIIDITHAPIGLNIGAETPDEISIAIISEIQAAFKNKKGGKLCSLKKPIHDRNEYQMEQTT
jgi:xanthine dehydrogenase accessory factor